jgi:hypothetical protein
MPRVRLEEGAWKLRVNPAGVLSLQKVELKRLGFLRARKGSIHKYLAWGAPSVGGIGERREHL